MKIVHIGKAVSVQEHNHIISRREAGHEVYVPGDSTGEQLVRRIIDADEIHIWDASMVFELGMVYFYSVHATHYRLSWVIRIFCEPDPELPVFQQQFNRGLDAGERPILFGPESDAIFLKTRVFVPPCGSGVGPCSECADTEKCDRLRAEHLDSDN